MKKIVLSLLTFGGFIYASAQSTQPPTFDFETWTGSGTAVTPSQWVTGNVLTGIPGNSQSVFKDSVNVHGGKYAMKIVTVDVATNPSAALIPDPVGFAMPGGITLIPAAALKVGYSYTARPATVEFWYKYAPTVATPADSANCAIALTKWSGTKRDTIAFARWGSPTAVTSYTKQSITLSYVSALLPDTMAIVFAATRVSCMTCGKVGSTLWVDDVAFLGWNGINEHPNSEGVIVFPNPANEFVTIAVDAIDVVSVHAYDAAGRMVSSATLTQGANGMNRKSGTLNTSNLPAGLYSYSMMDKEGNALRSGTFSVVR